MRVGATAPQSKTTNGPRAARARVVNAARQQLLAGAGGAEQEDRLDRRRRALEPGEEGAHRDAAAERLPEARGGGERQERGLPDHAHGEGGAADGRLAAEREDHLDDGQIADDRAVLAAEIAEHHAPLREPDLAVTPRDAGIDEHDVALGARAHHERRELEGGQELVALRRRDPDLEAR
jgi:hypothetical protein